MFMNLNSNWFLLMLVTVALGGLTQLYIKRTYAKWSRVGNKNGLSGAQAAQMILERNGIAASPGQPTGEGACAVVSVEGTLTDHYDPRTGIVSLSEGVYKGASIASVAVAAHETGHALQDAQDYTWGEIRTKIVPAVSFGSGAAGILIIMGFWIQLSGLMWLGILAYSLAVLFQIITLPVELNASRRALAQLSDGGMLSGSELPAARQVLTAAALTYVAAALISILNLLYYIGLARRN